MVLIQGCIILGCEAGCFLRFLVYLRFSNRKCPRPKWTIYKHVSDKSKKYMSVGNSGILSVVVVCVLNPAYTSLCKDLEYLPKVR